ncbi:LysM peptidoglycan-binding domain-containing protein [Trinickia terrae]|uniref:LysM peptidoglycan-binding domain-containing protein n=1 Tax=Trinickia terrae TaxID=2571161 RepID=A0A4U1HVT9_9BURK|nr:LysM domain-containing protein [Trinickia terrae]TKC83056.1 LysM peptidoglycan-binding domain-containing protein [Trinickia terrae]
MKPATSTKKTGFESWQNYVNNAASQPEKWNQYDCEIQTAVHEYNSHLGTVAGYMPLDWHLIKAMTWVETGAGKPEWNSSPIQIGNPGDPGLTALLNGNEGGEVTVKPGDRLEKIARVQGSTSELLRHLNPGTHLLMPGQTLKYRKGAVRKAIVGWKPITTGNIAAYYNVGDPMYAQKLDYALSVISKQKEITCAP